MPRVWWATDLPGYREHLAPFATYSPFPYAGLPPIERTLDDDLRWLRSEPVVPRALGHAEPGDPRPERVATAVELTALLGNRTVDLPRAFRTFISDEEPRTRVRSCTDSYLDLAEFRVDVAGGGSLIHFLSDQQWVLHWLLYVDPEGSEAVVVTESAFGFDAEGERFDDWDPVEGGMSVCAESFSEFLYRFWIENEIWFRGPGRGRNGTSLTDEQLRYAKHYH